MLWLTTLVALAPAPSLVVARHVGEPPVDSTSVLELEAAGAAAVAWFPALAARQRRDLEVSDEHLRGCGPDPQCLARVLEPTDVRHVVFVILDFRRDPAVVTAQVLDLSKRAAVATHFDMSGRFPKSSTKTLVRKCLVDAGHSVGAKVTVDVSPADADVRVGDRAVDSGVSAAFEPGTYDVVATAEGYEPTETITELVRDDHRKLSLELEASPTVVETWWFWTAVGVVAAGATVGTLAATGAFESSTICYGDCKPPK